MTGRSLDDCKEEVDASIRRLFHWGAYADKYGGQVQVRSLCKNANCTLHVHWLKHYVVIINFCLFF